MKLTSGNITKEEALNQALIKTIKSIEIVETQMFEMYDQFEDLVL